MLNENKLSSLLQEMREDLIDFAAEVVRTKSFTCREGDLARLIADKMVALGYDEVWTD